MSQVDGECSANDNAPVRQEISFATSADGTRIAWARHGTGPPFVRVGTWLTHIEHDWASPVWRHWLETLGEHFTVIRYDDRGSGLSDRSPADISLDSWVADLEAVIDAADLGPVALFGMSQGGAIAVAYAHAHAERVNDLILWGAYARGTRMRGPTASQQDEIDLEMQMIKVGWGRADPVFRRVFTTRFIPGASEAQMRWFDELQRQSMTSEMALASSLARSMVDVEALVPGITTRTLILHADDDRAVPFEEGRRLAAIVPGARFVPLHGQNHLLLAEEPAWPRFVAEVTAFVGAGAPPPVATHETTAPLTPRELQILRLVADGCSNVGIGTQLSLSTRTIERHLSNLYVKLSLSGRAARAAASARLADLEVTNA